MFQPQQGLKESNVYCAHPDCHEMGIHIREFNGCALLFCDAHAVIDPTEVLRVFDLLLKPERLEEWLEELSEQERERLYAHPLLKEIDLLP